MTATELTAAADRLDALADAATPGPWAHLECVGQDQATRRALGTYSLLHNDKVEIALLRGFPGEREPNASYIAAMSPPVAKALAEWLRAQAGYVALCVDLGVPAGAGAEEALDVARAILGATQ